MDEPPLEDLPGATFLSKPRNRAERRHLAALERKEARADERALRMFAALSQVAQEEEAEMSALLAEHGLEL